MSDNPPIIRRPSRFMFVWLPPVLVLLFAFLGGIEWGKDNYLMAIVHWITTSIWTVLTCRFLAQWKEMCAKHSECACPTCDVLLWPSLRMPDSEEPEELRPVVVEYCPICGFEREWEGRHDQN